MDQSEIAAAAEEFEAAQARGEHFPRAWFDRLTLDDAYRILLARIAHRQRQGARRIGWKIGLTATAIQQQLGVHEPVFGCLLAEGLVNSGHIFRRDALIEPAFENELCIVLDRDLPPGATYADVAVGIIQVDTAFKIIKTLSKRAGQLALALADNGE